MYNRAKQGVGYAGENPARGIERFRESTRDRFLEGGELPAFFQSLLAEPNEALRHFFLLALFTGARRGSLLRMKWADVNLDAALWRIPGEDAKAGEPITLPLCGPALSILCERRKSANGSPWVFPGHGKSGHIVEPMSAWKRICNRAGLTGVRIHDLRRSLGSWQAMLGASLPIIGKSLGHSQPTTTAIYARLQMDPVRASVETATAAMMQAGNLTIDVGGPKLLEQTEN
jgi:integrase